MDGLRFLLYEVYMQRSPPVIMSREGEGLSWLGNRP